MKNGFSLIETITAVAVFTILMATVYLTVNHFYKTNAYVIEQAFAVNSARIGVETMVREIREASYSDTGAYPIVNASTTEFIFYSDIDRDNSIEKIRYFLDGSDFKKGEIEASGDPLVYQPGDEVVNVLSDNVRNSGAQYIFAYFDSQGNEIADLSNITDITLVKVNLIINVFEGKGPDEFSLRSTAQIRNLKSNL